MTEQVSDPAIAPQEALGTNPVTDPLATLLQEIKDESGRQKYQDAETALKALKASQEYIPQLKTELQALKEKAELNNDLKTVQELLMLDSQTTPAPTSTPEAVTPAPSAEAPDLQAQFAEFLDAREAQTQAAKNKAQVQSSLGEQYGEKRSEVYEAKAKELGVNPEFLDALAEKSPQAVLAYFKGVTVPSTPTGTQSAPQGSTEAPKIPNTMHGADYATIKAAWDACKPV
jgi:hypothetical protein